MNSKKKTGSYYTPLDLADFIVQHLKPSLNDTNSILEPSVGDGAYNCKQYSSKSNLNS